MLGSQLKTSQKGPALILQNRLHYESSFRLLADRHGLGRSDFVKPVPPPRKPNVTFEAESAESLGQDILRSLRHHPERPAQIQNCCLETQNPECISSQNNSLR